MSKINVGRYTAQMDGDFVVFLIGMRINKPWKIHRWLPILFQMPKMLRELEAQPELGYLGGIFSFSVMIQYWRSFDHLEAYARSKDHAHLPAWVNFKRVIGYNNADVGIWHETYQISPGQYETMYGNMPAFGLGSVGG